MQHTVISAAPPSATETFAIGSQKNAKHTDTKTQTRKKKRKFSTNIVGYYPTSLRNVPVYIYSMPVPWPCHQDIPTLVYFRLQRVAQLYATTTKKASTTLLCIHLPRISPARYSKAPSLQDQREDTGEWGVHTECSSGVFLYTVLCCVLPGSSQYICTIIAVSSGYSAHCPTFFFVSHHFY